MNCELHITRMKGVVASFKLFRRNFQKELWDTTRILSEWQVGYQARGWKLNNPNIAMIFWVGIAQSALWLATGWTAERSDFEFR